MDVSKMNHLAITVNNSTFKISSPVLNWLLVCLIFAVVFIVIGNKFKKADPTKVPSKSLIVYENIVQIILGILRANLGKYAEKFIPLYGTILIVMIFANLLGLVGLQPPTTNVGVNFVFGLMYFILVQGAAIKTSGIVGRLKGLLEPYPFLLPLNILGEMALPISLSVRLFGNILSGSVIMLMVYSFMQYLGLFGILGFALTPVLHVYFDVFSGFIQGYVFMMLGSFFLGQNLEQ